MTDFRDALIASSREIGSTGVFDGRVNGRILHFDHEGGEFVDRETGSRWSITSEAVAGPLKGERLTPIDYGDYFSFAWFAFRPDTDLYTSCASEE